MLGWIRNALLILLVVLAAGCGGAFAEAIAQGDKYAEAGMWDEAAAAYEQAVKLDPSDADAQVKLKHARQQQALERLRRAEELEKRGEIVPALALVQEAVSLDKANTQAQRALNRITEAVLDRAEELMRGGQERQAFELTTLVLRGSPHHPRARRLDDQVRSLLAKKSFDAAKAFLEAGKRGNALVEFAACLHYRPDYPDAKLHFGQVKIQLEEELRYHVHLASFTGQGKNGSLSRALKPELIAQALDERLLLKVATVAPADGARGVDVRGTFEGYDYVHSQKRISKSCDYVCGEDTRPNPERPRLEQEVGDRERTMSQAEEELGRIQKDMMRYEQDLMRIQKDVDRKMQDVERARTDLDRCRGSADPANTSACSSERSRMESAQRSLESERRRLDTPRSNLESSRNRFSSAQDRRDSARRDRDSKLQELRNTPELITVPRYCPFNYQVELHQVGAEVTMKLSMAQLSDQRTILSDQPFRYETGHRDQTFPAHPGRCPEVAQGDALDLPSEQQMRQALVSQVIKDLRKKVMASYDSYRQEFLTAAQRHESAGLGEEAVEAYVRYVLTGPHVLKQKKQIAEFFSRAKGLSQLDALWSL
ncbi:MAG: tetratricopeptide repeat protein [Deltaproteobacteria bacterium]|nr:tetratricopeptide repeat protein [Deltaproteobacteria bacterium]MBW2531191.1 tetratricopeptide repeat protein [Deltaproteobacteria bacterium]